jgi:hypothetical protein
VAKDERKASTPQWLLLPDALDLETKRYGAELAKKRLLQPGRQYCALDANSNEIKDDVSDLSDMAVDWEKASARTSHQIWVLPGAEFEPSRHLYQIKLLVDVPDAEEAAPVDIADLPGDKPGERRARRFLSRLMDKHPKGLGRKTRDDFLRVCKKRFGISGRAFDGIWDWAIDCTGAVAFRKSGPRGSHTNRRRSK